MKKVFAAIASVWHLLLGQTDPKIATFLEEAVKTAGKIKSLLSNPIVEGAISLTGTDVDNKIAKRTNDVTEKVLTTLLNAQGCTSLPSQGERIACLLKIAYERIEAGHLSKDDLLKNFARTYLQTADAVGSKLNDNLANVLVENKIFADKNPASN